MSDPTSLRSAPAELAGQVAVAEAVTKHGAQPFEEIAGMLEVVAEYCIADAFGTMSFGRVAAEQSFELPPLDLLEALLRQQAMGLEQGEAAALAEVVQMMGIAIQGRSDRHRGDDLPAFGQQ